MAADCSAGAVRRGGRPLMSIEIGQAKQMAGRTFGRRHAEEFAEAHRTLSARISSRGPWWLLGWRAAMPDAGLRRRRRMKR